MPAAAAVPVRNVEGSGQKGPSNRRPDRRQAHCGERPEAAAEQPGEDQPGGADEAPDKQVPLRLLHPVGDIAPHDHARDRADDIGNHRQEAGLEVRDAQRLDDLRYENDQPHARSDDAEIDDR